MMKKNLGRENAAVELPMAGPVADAPRWVLLALLFIYCALTLLLIVRVPLGAAPDETNHIYYVEHLASVRALPVFKPEGGNANPGYEFHQPPLYYTLCAVLWSQTGAGVQNYLCRIVSLVFGTATLILLWHAMRAALPGQPNLTILATGVAALLPLHQAIGAAASNDAAAGFFCALIFLLIARGTAEKWTTATSIWMGLAIGLGILSKMSCLSVGIVGLGAACHIAWRQSEPPARWKHVLPTFAIVATVSILVCGWWLVRNTSLYGDPLAMKVFEEAFGNSSSRTAAFLERGTPLTTYIRALLLAMFCTTWGLFGGVNTALGILNPFSSRGPLPEAIPALLPMAVLALTTVAVIAGLIRWTKENDTPPAQRAVWLWWLLGTLVVWLAWLSFNLSYFQGQARYVHPSLVPLVGAWAIGWYTIAFASPKRGWVLSGLFALLLIGLTLWNGLGWQTLV
jgi:4-amino-4-deoxy-L-arabinose transferase-like glycosyltransferase